MSVLLTGFPGFIGARLLPRLLELSPEEAFVCLVQERFLDVARRELDAIEARLPAARGRLATAVGDITQSGLMLSADDAVRLRRELTAAYHLAAVYDLAVSRELGTRVNVEGTRNVLAFLAEATHLERLHYVSTAYVAGSATGVFRESDLDVGQGFKNHYEETKFLAEVEVVRSGVPAAVYRPSVVVGDSRTGETGKFDGPYFTLTAMEKVPSPGVFVRIGSGKNPVNLVPVDFVVEALARLSTQRGTGRNTYHLTDPHPLAVIEVERMFARALGKSFAYVPVPKGLAKAVFGLGPVERHFGMPAQSLDYFDHPLRFDTTEAGRALAALGLECPRLPDYADRLVSFYLQKRGAVRREAMV
ncbi:MAG: acyl-CoA reductase [Acidobacteria bacterium]|nr:MAG: acyl-CoA reductase [Acidobacteriota bacterium]